MLDYTEFENDENEVAYADGLPLNPEMIYNNVTADYVRGCWNWIGPWLKRKPRIVLNIAAGGVIHYLWMSPHRYAYMVFNNARLPTGFTIFQKCGNPACCNPEHLVGAQSPNIEPHPVNLIGQNQQYRVFSADGAYSYSGQDLKRYIEEGYLPEWNPKPETPKPLNNGYYSPPQSNVSYGYASISQRAAILEEMWSNYQAKGGRFYTRDGRRIKSFMRIDNGYTGVLNGALMQWNLKGDVVVGYQPGMGYALKIGGYRHNDNDPYKGPNEVPLESRD